MEFKNSEKISINYKTNLKNGLLNLLEQKRIKLDTDRKDQHLLINVDIVNKLINSAELNPEDVVLEIGPGPGQITEAIAQKARKVYAIEIDTRFKPILEDLQKRYKNLEVIFGSALDIKWPDVNKLVSNPPYSILEPLIERLAREKKITSSSLILGEKYYQRCVTKPDKITKTSLITLAFFDVKLISKIEGKDFYPEGRENSVLMKLVRKDKRKTDFGLRLLASRMIHTPDASVIGFMKDIIGQNINLKSINHANYKFIPTVASLKIPESTLRKSFRNLDNIDIRILTDTLANLKRKLMI